LQGLFPGLPPNEHKKQITDTKLTMEGGTEAIWQSNNMTIVLPILLTLVFYSLYWITVTSGRLKLWFSRNFEPDSANILFVLSKRTAGFLLLGVVPLSLYIMITQDFSLADAGLGLNPEKSLFTIICIVLLSLIIIPVISHNSRKPEIMAVYPEIRASRWTNRMMIAETGSWALYLLGYETLFRGLLLFPLAESVGQVTAIVINTVLYSAAHLPKGKTETIAAIPFGIVLCILTLHSGTIWIAFIAHLVNALTMTFTAVKFNPEILYFRNEEEVRD
jgi:membrane protease YdiL (CAAX protease family)